MVVIKDLYSRFYEVAITKRKNSETVIEVLKKLFYTHGYPETLMGDNAAEFQSVEVKDLLRTCNIKQRFVTQLHTAANDEVERQNHSLLKRTRIAKASGQDWEKTIYDYLFAYRNTPHSITGIAPTEMFFKRKLRKKLPNISLYGQVEVDIEQVRDNDLLKKFKTKQYIDSKRHAIRENSKLETVFSNEVVKAKQIRHTI